MKKLGILFIMLGAAFVTQAQVDSTVKKVEHKTAKVASKSKSAVVDEIYKDKVGPDGQTIYIDHSSKYYYVDDRGKKVYVTKISLKNKPKS
ncbi:MAG: hypothetical protein M3N30_05625 [Bacteroidota bacterium]|nr:hypothetical protein [Bacteroidota bacterium]